MPAAHDVLTPDELATLEQEWTQGDLLDPAVCVLAFCEFHRGEIFSSLGVGASPDALLHAVKHLILRSGGVNYHLEMRAQLRALHDEIWIRGERGDHDRERIVADWVVRHAPEWRR